MAYSHWFLHTANQCFVSLRLVFFSFEVYIHTHTVTVHTRTNTKKQTEIIHTRKFETVYDKAQQPNR